jgi:S-disulfanyl-L-cysteine oxidoreductase SoxD
MFMRSLVKKRLVVLKGLPVVARIVVLFFSMVCFVQAVENSPNLGKPAAPALLKNWNLDVFPDGTGLPAGSGTVAQGKKVYQQYCQSCHGVDGIGDSAEELAGAQHGLTDNPPDKTIGTYWQYSTTLFDFTRRAMPLNAPGVLNNEQVYSVTAYLLYLNHLIKEAEVMNAQTLPKVKMPNRDGFINSYR